MKRVREKFRNFLLNTVSRKSNIWAFGSIKYGHSTRFLFEYVLEQEPNIKAIWLTRDMSLAKEVRAMGYPSYHNKSLLGIYYSLRAKYYFTTHGVRALSRKYYHGAKHIYLCHGIGIKSAELSTTIGPSAEEFQKKRSTYQPPDFMTSTTPHVNKKQCASFLVSEEQCMPFGTPRNDHFFKSKESQLQYLKKHAPNEFDFVNSLEKYAKIFSYILTWRDVIDKQAVDESMDYHTLNQYLKRRNQVLVRDTHPGSTYNTPSPGEYSNIVFIPKGCDLNLILPFIDVLITDYSSVYYDYILLNKPAILYPYDYDYFTKTCRTLYYDFYESTEGPYAYNFQELFELIKQDLPTPDYTRIKKLFWGDYTGESCKNITNFIKQLDQK